MASWGNTYCIPHLSSHPSSRPGQWGTADLLLLQDHQHSWFSCLSARRSTASISPAGSHDLRRKIYQGPKRSGACSTCRSVRTWAGVCAKVCAKMDRRWTKTEMLYTERAKANTGGLSSVVGDAVMQQQLCSPIDQVHGWRTQNI